MLFPLQYIYYLCTVIRNGTNLPPSKKNTGDGQCVAALQTINLM